MNIAKRVYSGIPCLTRDTLLRVHHAFVLPTYSWRLLPALGIRPKAWRDYIITKQTFCHELLRNTPYTHSLHVRSGAISYLQHDWLLIKLTANALAIDVPDRHDTPWLARRSAKQQCPPAYRVTNEEPRESVYKENRMTCLYLTDSR